MALNDDVLRLRAQRTAGGGPAMPKHFQEVTKARIRDVLAGIDLGTNVDLVDGVFALMDNETPSRHYARR